ncbi:MULTISPECIES: BON domain-containing protein [Limnobacter]|uniref:Transporter n=1 Tax=Limnobacter litoralis TaxID=481366 RepID=A0ABQ5YL70_9BURK|nr:MULTISPECIES: BON domain-containing protein [Limnobacter]GLR25295.1 transporter [Limnobacter litoralis]HEX5484650.1 BON domain-containing protein [Limnobacter sp.]
MMKIKKAAISSTVALALTLPLLSGCFFGAAAALTTSTLAASDRRTVGTQVEDRTIQLKATNIISGDFGDTVHVNVTVYNRHMLLTGEAPDETTRRRVEGAVSNIANLHLVTNDIKIAGNSSLTSRTNDTLLTTKVKASLLDAQDVFGNAFKVTTEAGSVYLMGLVTEREADRAAQIAAGVSGVTRVVKVIDPISEAELKTMTATPNTNSNPDAGGNVR